MHGFIKHHIIFSIPIFTTAESGEPLSPEKQELQRSLSRQMSRQNSKPRGVSVSSYSETVKVKDDKEEELEEVL